jgi:hypothetical protein
MEEGKEALSEAACGRGHGLLTRARLGISTNAYEAIRGTLRLIEFAIRTPSLPLVTF